MRRVFGPRTVVEAAFLVAVPVVAAAIGSGMWTIIAASAVAYLLIFVLEATLWREGGPAPALGRLRRPARAAVAQEPAPAAEAAAPAPAPVPVPAPEPEPAPAVVVEPAPVAAPIAPVIAEVVPEQHVRVLHPEPPAVPEPAPEPEPEPERVPLAAVPEPAPEPTPPPPPPAAPEPVPTSVVPIGVSASPRQWNLWDLERLTRESSGPDPVADEERQFLLLYLREFADSDGLLPIDFDGLVRDSFGELVGAR
ncbi:MAG TPA: hypothetical protein VGN27_08535 [Gaiellaceae bacterium]|nr:hypothetical protein [Gaiellaceae bacterium]